MKKTIISAAVSAVISLSTCACAGETDTGDDGNLITSLKCGVTVLDVKTGKAPGMTEFLSAVNAKWNLDALSAYLKHNKDSLTDGTVYASSDDIEDETNYYFISRIIKKTDGTPVYAYVHGHSEGIGNEICFYSYNAEKSEFVPYSSPVLKQKSSYKYTDTSAGFDEDSDDLHMYTLFMYNESDEAVMSIEHTYTWDGNSYILKGAKIWSGGDVKTAYDQEMKNRSKMALVDIDRDNIPELWISSDDETQQEIFSLNDGIRLIADSAYGPPSFTFTANGVLSSDPDGFNHVYTSLKDSRPKDRYSANCRIEGEKEVCKYTINGKNVTEKEWSGKAAFLNKTEKITPEFEKLLEIN